ncbi:PREDICTED: ran-binding protein 1 homolog c-like isoform 1 [Fragaria vesca subsp. vesca]
MSSADAEHREEEEPLAGDDEDTGAQVAPIVRLEEVAVSTGEENEDAILDLKAKLYRFDKDGNQWKERGAGTVKLLKHKESSKVRLVMRQSKTLKICANHLVLPKMTVQEHAGNEKSCVWHATDFADGELKEELFCIRFASIENFSECRSCYKPLSYANVIDNRLFMEKFQEVAESQEPEGESEDANAAAGLLETLKVEEKETTAEKKDEEAAPAAVKEEEKDIKSDKAAEESLSST